MLVKPTEKDRYKLFVMKDEKSASWGAPITFPTRGMFVRDFIQENLARGESVYAKHPQDFAVYEVGEYDPFTGEIHLHENKHCLGLVQDFKMSLGASN